MNRRTFALSLTLLGALAAGCSSQSASPITAPMPLAVTTPPTASQACAFPAPAATDRVYMFAAPLAPEVHDYTRCSRFVLSRDGRFALQYGTVGAAYSGSYAVAGTSLDFAWDGRSTAGLWESSAQLSGGTLTVRYGQIMSLSDFEDAVYR